MINPGGVEAVRRCIADRLEAVGVLGCMSVGFGDALAFMLNKRIVAVWLHKTAWLISRVAFPTQPP